MTLSALALASTLFGLVVGLMTAVVLLLGFERGSQSVWLIFIAVATWAIASVMAALVAAIAGLPFALLAHLLLRRIGTGPIGVTVSAIISMLVCSAVLVLASSDGDRSMASILSGGWMPPAFVAVAGVATVASWLILRRLRPSGIPA